MANPKGPPEYTRFKPGQSGNLSGKPKQLLTKDKVSSILGKFATINQDELTAVVDNPKSQMIEIMIASIMIKAAKDGDYSRLNFLLERSIGKVKDIQEILLPKPTVVERLDGSSLVLSAEEPQEES